MDLNVQRSEVYRYLGYRGAVPDAQVCAAVEDCLETLLRECSPRSLWRVWPLVHTPEGLSLEGVILSGKAVARHLRESESAALFAATLGAEADRLLLRLERENMARALVMQASAAAYIEAYCDLCGEEIARQTGHSLLPRFSPGYGDFPLSIQPEIIKALDAQKKIGLTVTKSLMLAPTKSVTAVIGLVCGEKPRYASGCEGCDAENCSFRAGS